MNGKVQPGRFRLAGENSRLDEKSAEEPRIDAREKVTGAAQYVEDLPDPPGMVYAADLLSPYSHARIVSVDSSCAERLPGVLAVLHRENLEGLDPTLPSHRHDIWNLPSDQTFVATDKVRFDGELVAQVVAEDLRTARHALGLIEVEYQELPAVFDAEQALAAGAPILHESKASNLLLEDKLEWGDVEQGFNEADRIIEETYTSPSMFHHPMEHVGSCVAQFEDGEIDLWAPISSPYRDAQQIAHIFGLDPGRVRVRVPYVGGGFGAKQLTNSMLAALFLARKVGRPVKVVASVAESFRQNARHAMVYKARIGVKADGTLTTLDVDLVVDTGAYTTGGATATHNAVISAWGCYRLPHFRCRARCAYTNKVPASHTRATGKVQTTWGVECAMDQAARELGLNPVEFRKKNVLRRGEFVYKGTPLMDTDYLDLMRQATLALDWDDGSSGVPAEGSAVPRIAKGRGLALSLRHGSQAGGKASAMVSLDGEGILKVQHNAPEIGQGTHNLISIVASRVLGIPRDQIVVAQPDTGVADLPFAGVSAQRTTVQMGKAVEDACANLKRELVALACRVKGGGAEEWIVANGRLWRAENSLSFGEIVATLGLGARLQSLGNHSPPKTERGSAFRGMDHWAPSAAAAEVEVDRETGEFRIVGFAVIADAGEALHYPSAKSQVEGGAVMGVGHAMFEEVVYQEGRILNADPFQYRLPLMEEIPEAFYASMLENQDGPGPFGSKGMSQTSIVTVAPAIGNAIHDAIGVRIRSLPITPEKILRGMEKVKKVVANSR